MGCGWNLFLQSQLQKIHLIKHNAEEILKWGFIEILCNILMNFEGTEYVEIHYT